MGRDKLLLEIDGKPLLGRAADALSTACDEILVVGSGGGELPPGATRVPDGRSGAQGPLAGIEAGLSAARHPLAFVAAGDMPFLEPGFVAHLLDRLVESGAAAVAPRLRGRVHPLCAAYSRDVLPLVRTALDGGVRAVREFLSGLDPVAYAGESDLRRFGDPELLLTNVNSPEDLERARGLSRR